MTIGKYGMPTAEIVENALVMPLTYMKQSNPPDIGLFDGGVYYPDRSFVELSRQLKGMYRNEPQEISKDISENYMTGRHVFGGMLQNEHFGHFITESITRLWWVQQLGQAGFDSIVFYLRHPELSPTVWWHRDTFDAICAGARFTFVRHPTRFEELIVPSQLAHLEAGMLYGHKFNRSLLTRGPFMPTHHKKIYVSRSRFGSGAKGMILNESEIESLLSENGYEIIHPQTLTVREQIAIYRSADMLVFADGSALHLYAMVAKPTQRVFVVWRRNQTWVFAWQIKTFGGPELVGTPCIDQIEVPEAAIGQALARSVVNIDRLRLQLLENEFIPQSRTVAKPALQLA